MLLYALSELFQWGIFFAKKYALVVALPLSPFDFKFFKSKDKRDVTKTIYYEDVLNEVSDLELHLSDDKESDLSQCIDEFLHRLDKKKRIIFVLRY